MTRNKREPGLRNPIEAAVRAWVETAVELASGRADALLGPGFDPVDQLRERYPAMMPLVARRVRAALGEVLNGDPPPPLARQDVDGFDACEIDLVAERVVAELRAARGPNRIPDWPARLNAAIDAGLEIAEREASRAHQVAPATRAAEPAEDGGLGRYLGVWKDGVQARRGDLLTDRGSLWHAERDTGERPGSSPAWRLMVKSVHPPRKASA
jgi:hypothetical protein